MKNILSIILVLIFIISGKLLQAQDRDISYMASGGKLKPLQAIMDIRHYTIALDVDMEQQLINGHTTIDLILSSPTDTILFDLVHLLKVKKITTNNKNSSFFQKGDLIYITAKDGFQAGKQTVKIEYGGKPPIAVNPPWAGGYSWKKDTNNNPWVAINCQFEGGKIYFPSKDHPSDEPNEGVDLFITVPKGLTVAGPGLLQNAINKKDDKTTFHWKTNYTISNYCIVFNIGKYNVFNRNYTTSEGNVVPIQLYTLDPDIKKAEYLLDIKERDTHILEKYFGEYPWVKEKIGIAEVPNSGMEHQTMITFKDSLKFTPIPGNLDYSDVYFHEFAHEWWANKVTNKDWAHMWIQEGIATYATALFYREVAGESGYDSIMNKFRMSIKNKKPLVQGEEINTVNTYSGDIYVKGAFFMHTLRYILGDSIFFPTLKELATNEKYTYDNFVTTDDVEKLFSKKSGKDLKPMFDFFLRTTNRLEINITQTSTDEYWIQSINSPMNLPIDILSDTGKKQIILDNKGLKIKSKTMPIIDSNGYYFKKVVLL
ncbi:M1 family metallopeptidase [Daejeonella sp.]|jgi:aminopeptidase N|uniref:M1 family metallopeptidase n=1 Tax=Daejeonella sp. TaxID=2805397 RepID=UPI00378360BC